MRILIVDDHPVMRFGVRQLVERRWPDAELGEAASLAEALEQVRTRAWELAVLDLSLPDASGVEGLVQLRRVVRLDNPVATGTDRPEAVRPTEARTSGIHRYRRIPEIRWPGRSAGTSCRGHR